MRLALPEWRRRPDDGARVVRDIDAWATSDELIALVEASGGRVDRSTGAERIAELAEFSLVWDARASRERDQAAVIDVATELADRVAESAERLGQAGSHVPSSVRYDSVLMTAGMVRAEVVKPRFVRELLEGGLRFDEIAFLGAFRPFSAEERDLGSALGFDATDEVDAMVEGLEREFGPLGEPHIERSDGDGASGWRDYTWHARDVRFRVLAAPSSAVPRRANTADTFRFWADRRAPSADRVLAVTTPIYVPYQATVAVDVLGRGAGVAVETVGATATSLDLGDLSQPFRPQHHLQELRSAILAMRALRAALTSEI